MATTIFGILASILLVLASWVGFKNKQAKEAQAAQLHNEKRIEARLTATNKALRESIKASNETYQADLLLLTESFNERDQKEKEKANLIAKLEGLKTKIVGLKASLEDYKEKVPSIPDVDKLIANLQETKKEIAELDESIANLKSENEELAVKIKNTNGTIEFNSGVVANQAGNIAQSFLSTKVTAVYKNWGFVVLQDGDVKGVTPRSALLVKRGEDIICELVVKNATNGAATAEILFDTMLEGEFVQVGDEVVAKLPKKIVDPNAEKVEEPIEDEVEDEDEDEDLDF